LLIATNALSFAFQFMPRENNFVNKQIILLHIIIIIIIHILYIMLLLW